MTAGGGPEPPSPQESAGDSCSPAKDEPGLVGLPALQDGQAEASATKNTPVQVNSGAC